MAGQIYAGRNGAGYGSARLPDGVGVRGFKMQHRLVGPGVPQLFPDQAGDRLRIVAQGIDFVAQFPGNLFLLLLLGVQPVNFPAHPLVLLDERQVFLDDQDKNRRRYKDAHRFGKPAPDAKFKIHHASLRARSREVKADFIVFGQFMV